MSRPLLISSCAAPLCLATALLAPCRGEAFIEQITPPTVQRGKTTRVTLIGTEFGHPLDLWTSLPAGKLRAKPICGNSTSAIFDLKVAPDAPVGVCGVRLASVDGLSNIHLFLIDDLPVQPAPVTKDQPAKVALPAALWGRFRKAEVDRFAINAKAGERVSFEVVGNRFGEDAAVRMLSAEQILDAISQASGMPEAFPGYPLGTRALELAEGGIEHSFLQAFARPVRDVSCECAREEDPSLPQMLHLLNNKKILDKIQSPKSRLARWLREEKDTSVVIQNIYLAILSRRPSKSETDLILQHIACHQGNRVQGLQDLQYALFNSSEFLLRH